MATTNLEKFQEIEKMMEQAKPLLDSYLKDLEERHEYMSVYRSEYRKLRNVTKKIASDIEKDLRSREDTTTSYENVKYNIQAVYERLKEIAETEIETKGASTILEEMRDAKGSLNKSKEVNIKALKKINDVVKKYNIPVPLLEQFIEEYETEDVIGQEAADTLLNELKQGDSMYLSSFRGYRQACEEDDEVYEYYSDVVDDFLDFGLTNYGEALQEVLPESTEKRVGRPDGEALLDVLAPIKSSGLEYFQSKNRNSHGYYYNSQYAKELAYVRRALLEDREYIGTRNAFNRLTSAFEQLSDYMYERYHQLGGTPVNYHGHDDRKK